MPLNVNAKAFVPTFGGGGGSSTPPQVSSPTQPAPPPPPRITFFRYTIHSSSSNAAALHQKQQQQQQDENGTANGHPDAPPFSLVGLQSKGVIRSSASGGMGPTPDALMEWTTNYFNGLERQLDSTRVGFFASAELLGQSATAMEKLPGYLLPLIIPSRPNADNYRQLLASWQTMMYELQTNPQLRGVGHITRVYKQEEGGPINVHYFYMLLSHKDAIPSDKIFELVTLARNVIPVNNLLSVIFEGRRMVATLQLNDSSPVSPSTTPTPQNGEGAATEFSGAHVIEVPASLEKVHEMNDRLAHALTDGAATVLLKLNTSIPDIPTQPLTPDYYRIVIRTCWDYMITPTCVLLPPKRRAEFDQLFGETGKNGPVLWDTLAPVIGVAAYFSQRSLHNASECEDIMLRYASSAPTSTSVVRNDIPAVMPMGSRCGSPFNSSIFSPVEDMNTYLAVRDLITQVVPYCDTARDEYGDSRRTKRLRRSNFKAATTNITRETYRIRRTAAGERILLVIDSVQNLFLIDSATQKHLVQLPSWRGIQGSPLCWSGNLTGVNCVLEGTVVTSFRGENQFKIIVHDVLMWNHSLLTEMTLPQRLQEIDHPGLDDETNWAAPSPLGVVVLRTAYVPAEKGAQLLSPSHTEHATLGLTFVPCNVTRKAGDRLPLYSWTPPESTTVNFVAKNVKDVTEEGAPAAYHVNRLPLLCRRNHRQHLTEDEAAAVAIPVDESALPSVRARAITLARAAEEFLMEYQGEYVDYLIPTAPSISPFSTVQCLLIREADGAHWWEVIKEYMTYERARADTKNRVESLVHDPSVSSDEIIWICGASAFLCQECLEVDEHGAEDTTVHKFYCRKCWEKYGYGDCKQCALRFTPGSLDQGTNTFYCKQCWALFMTPPQAAQEGVTTTVVNMPASPNTEGPVSNEPGGKRNRVHGVLRAGHLVLIDNAARTTATTDVLELCCGESEDVRKWIEVGTQSYLGVDITTSVLDAARKRWEVMKNQLQEQGSELPQLDCLCGDCFTKEFWTTHLAKTHPSQFNVIACPRGFAGAFGEGRDSASAVLAGIAGSLVPNGVFTALVIDAGAVNQFLNTKNEQKRFHSELFTVEVQQDAPSEVNLKPERKFYLTVGGNEQQEAALSIHALQELATGNGLECLSRPTSSDEAADNIPFIRLSDYILNSKDKAAKETLNGLSDLERTLLSFYRVVLCRKGAVIAPLSEPSNTRKVPETPCE